MRTYDCEKCYVCGSQGVPIHKELKDWLFQSEGLWTICRCANKSCGLLWQNPCISDSDLPLAYKYYYTHSESQVNPKKRHRLAELVRNSYLARKLGYTHLVSDFSRFIWPAVWLLPGGRDRAGSNVMYLSWRGKGSRVLDLGCGDGAMLAHLRRLGWEPVGVEFDSAACQTAKHLYGIEVYNSNLLDVKFPARHFDSIVMRHVIEHLTNARETIAECFRILKPGGELIIVTPNAESLGHSLFKQDWRGLEPPRHIRIFSVSSLSRLLRENGFHAKVNTSLEGSTSIFTESIKIRKSRITGSLQRRNDIKIHFAAHLYRTVEKVALAFDRTKGTQLVAKGIRPLTK